MTQCQAVRTTTVTFADRTPWHEMQHWFKKVGGGGKLAEWEDKRVQGLLE